MCCNKVPWRNGPSVCLADPGENVTNGSRYNQNLGLGVGGGACSD